MKRKLAFAIVMGLSIPHNVQADDATKDQAGKAETVRSESVKDGAREKGGERRIAEYAARYKVSEDQVRELREKGLGWGEVRHALSIAERAKVPVSEVMKRREAGAGWGEIARQYGIKLRDGSHGRDGMRGAKEHRENGGDAQGMRMNHERGHEAQGPRGR